MIKRDLTKPILQAVKKFPIIGIVGPRQSGKTTLAQSTFQNYTYVNLEELDVQRFAQEDPRGFLERYPTHVILDEIQRVPQLFSYLQVHTDKNNQPGQYVLTGSQHFLFMKNVSQSLAGRIGLFTLLPLSHAELKAASITNNTWQDYAWTGGFPRLFSSHMEPSLWYPNYIQTYIERDIRSLQNVTDLVTFQTFLKLCAGRVGQLVNYSSLAQDAGISHNTARKWLSLLETSFVVFCLPPYYKNFNKRLVKSSKLYFIDTGLACWLLGIKTKDQLLGHYLAGGLFENWTLSEYRKYHVHKGQLPDAYFWRDKTGHEIDILVSFANHLSLLEIKSGKTYTDAFTDNLRFLKKISEAKIKTASVIYGGDSDFRKNEIHVYSWKSLSKAFSVLS